MKHVTPCSMIPPPPTSSTPSPFSDPASCPVVCSFARTWSMQQSLTTRPLHVLTPDSLPDIHGYLMQVTLTASGQSITCALSYARATPLTSLWLSNLLSDRLLPLPPPPSPSCLSLLLFLSVPSAPVGFLLPNELAVPFAKWACSFAVILGRWLSWKTRRREKNPHRKTPTFWSCYCCCCCWYRQSHRLRERGAWFWILFSLKTTTTTTKHDLHFTRV